MNAPDPTFDEQIEQLGAQALSDSGFELEEPDPEFADTEADDGR